MSEYGHLIEYFDQNDYNLIVLRAKNWIFNENSAEKNAQKILIYRGDGHLVGVL